MSMSDSSRELAALLIQRLASAVDAGERDDVEGIVQEAIDGFARGERAASEFTVPIIWNRADISDRIVDCFGIEVTDAQAEDLLHSIRGSLEERCAERGYEVIETLVGRSEIVAVLIDSPRAPECSDEFLLSQFAECSGDLDGGTGIGCEDAKQLRTLLADLMPEAQARFGINDAVWRGLGDSTKVQIARLHAQQPA